MSSERGKCISPGKSVENKAPFGKELSCHVRTNKGSTNPCQVVKSASRFTSKIYIYYSGCDKSVFLFVMCRISSTSDF